MKKVNSLFIIFAIIFSLFSKNVFADIDLIVSPIRYEIQLNPGATTTRTAKLINKTNNELQIYTSVSDFESNDSYGNPTFVRKSELVNPDQELASWININTSSFMIWALEEMEISFEINVPTDATPGWHYWAVFFKTFWEDNPWTNLKINVDYWVLLLINVDWEIIDNTTTLPPIINTWWGGRWNNNLNNTPKIDNCPFWDFTSSNFDWKCFDTFWLENAIEKVIKRNNNNDKIKLETWENNVNTWSINNQNNNSDFQSAEEKEEDKFKVEISIPLVNEWNTHVKPDWKVTLLDENWNIIKWIWDKSIINESGTIIWTEIVDYLPINDWGWNVLPNSDRIFTTEWKWFPYEWFDKDWKRVIKYWTPSEYYTRLNLEDRKFILPWQRINSRLEQKKVTALIELWYTNYQWEKIKFNSAEEFYVDYKTEYIWLNPYAIIAWILSLWIFWFIIFLFRKATKRKCEKCWKKIKKKMKVCPYCWTKQKNYKK